MEGGVAVCLPEEIGANGLQKVEMWFGFLHRLTVVVETLIEFPARWKLSHAYSKDLCGQSCRLQVLVLHLASCECWSAEEVVSCVSARVNPVFVCV